MTSAPPPPPAGEQNPSEGQWTPPPAQQWSPPPAPPSQPAGPPPEQYGPPPRQYGPPQQYGAPPAGPYGGTQRSAAAFDPKSVNQLDWGILGAGVLAFIFSLFDYYTVSYSFGGISESASASAWHGFFGWFAALMALAGAAVVAVELFSPQTKLPAPARLVGLGLFAVSTLCVILALFVFPGGDVSGAGLDEGHGLGYWVSLIVIIAGLVLSYLRFTQTGGTLPVGGKRPGGAPPAA